MQPTYHILDEPRPGALERIAVNPMWALLAIMVAGAWLSWPWFIVNAIALGSPTRTREIAGAVVGFAVTLAMALVALFLLDRGVIEGELAVRLIGLVIVAWKLGVSYTLFLWQNRTFHLYEYYGGSARQGLAVIIAGYFATPYVIEAIDSAVWRVIVSGGIAGGV